MVDQWILAILLVRYLPQILRWLDEMKPTQLELHVYQMGWIPSHVRECDICLARMFLEGWFSSWLKYWRLPMRRVPEDYFLPRLPDL